MSTVRETPRVGELRPSQILTTFGVGAIVDLPHISALVMGLEDWPNSDYREINEERLLASVRDALGGQVMALRTPPIVPDSDRSNPFEQRSMVGVPVAPFPRWMVCPRCRRLAPLSSNQFILKSDPFRPDRTKYVHENCKYPGKSPTVIPARFIVACKQGHLDDFPWVEFVHHGKSNCAYKLQLLELGPSGEAADVYVKCETCDTARPMSDAFRNKMSELPPCRGRRPHLRDFEENGCTDEQGKPVPVRAMLQGASNSWFPLIMSVLSVPQSNDLMKQLVVDHWSDLYDIESEGEIAKLRRRNLLREFLNYTDAELWAAIQNKKDDAGVPKEAQDDVKDLKTPEWNVFSDPSNAQRTDDFRLRQVKPPASYSKYFEKIVLVERLREVRSLIGFTRIESPGDYENPADFPASQRVEISRGKPKWVPSNEIRGEGIFFQFNENEILKWVSRVANLDRVFFKAHMDWRTARGLPYPKDHYPHMRFILLHSFAHALIRQLSLECGYTAASLRERIYSREPGQPRQEMAGVLVYTAAPDSEGTLGGLVSLGHPQLLERHLNQALDSMRLCSSDPLCAEHTPDRDGTSLHAASCHACLFAPETSCERGNKYLDRSVLVETVDKTGLAFFHLDASEDGAATDPTVANTEELEPAAEEAPADAIQFYDLVSLEVIPGTSKVQIPKELGKSLGIEDRFPEFTFLDGQSAKPPKNSIVIVKHPNMMLGSEKVKLACGKIFWQHQVDVASGDNVVLITIRAKGTPVKFKLSEPEWEEFKPIAVLIAEMPDGQTNS